MLSNIVRFWRREESFETLDMAEDGHYFQHDNDPKQTSKNADQWFSDNNITPLKWPAQSPDDYGVRSAIEESKSYGQN